MATDRDDPLLRDDHGELRAMLDSCHHRGASLRASERGRLARAAIVCPYHAWTYDLPGRLLRTGARPPPVGFDRDAHGLRALPVRDWNGFVFVCLDPEPPPFAAGFDQPLERLDAWRLADCVSVHPELARLVPVYAQGVLEAAAGAPASLNGLRPGARSWTTTGEPLGPQFPRPEHRGPPRRAYLRDRDAVAVRRRTR